MTVYRYVAMGTHVRMTRTPCLLPLAGPPPRELLSPDGLELSRSSASLRRRTRTLGVERRAFEEALRIIAAFSVWVSCESFRDSR